MEINLEVDTSLGISLRSKRTREMLISNGTKSIKHVRLSRGEYYHGATIRVVRQTGTGVLKFITRVRDVPPINRLVECRGVA